MTDQDIDAGLAHRINELIRKKEGEKTAEQIAEDLGVSPAGLHKWRRQGKVKKSKLIEIARYFGVSVDYLLTGEYQWGETPSRRAWIEAIESMTPEQERRFRAIGDALVVADSDKTGDGDNGQS